MFSSTARGPHDDSIQNQKLSDVIFEILDYLMLKQQKQFKTLYCFHSLIAKFFIDKLAWLMRGKLLANANISRMRYSFKNFPRIGIFFLVTWLTPSMKKQKVGVVNILSCNRLQQYPALWQFPIDFHTFTFSQLLNRQLDSACAFFSNESIYNGFPILFSSFFVEFMWPFISIMKSDLVRFRSTNSKQLTMSSLGLQIPFTGYFSKSQQDQIYSPAELKTSLQANYSLYLTNMISFQV